MAQKFTNNAESTLAGAISAVDTTMTIQSGHGALFPSLGVSDYAYITLTKLVLGVPTREIVKATARLGDVFTIVRAQEGTTALAFLGGDNVGLRPTAGGMNNKLDKTGDTMAGDLDMDGNDLTDAVLSDFSLKYTDSAASGALDYTNGAYQRWAPAVGAQVLSVANWPPSGQLGTLTIEGVNLGAATITCPTVKWIKNDGTFATNTSLNTNNGTTLQAAGIDFVVLWTRDAGATIYGKIVR